MNIKILLFKILSVVSFVLGCYWLSEMGSPLLHCHSSPYLVGIISGTSEAPEKLDKSWLSCSLWDQVGPRPSHSEASAKEFQNWKSQLNVLKRIEKILPSPQYPFLVVENKTDPFEYNVSERKLVLGTEVLRSKNLLLRALLQAWLYQVDQTGLDTFQLEILTDFLMVAALEKAEYHHPVTGYPVNLSQRRYWPEEALGFRDYCLSETASLQHHSLCLEISNRNMDPTRSPTLWSARLFALSELNSEWQKMNLHQRWRSLTQLASKLTMTPAIQKVENFDEAKNQAVQNRRVGELLALELEALKRLLNLDFEFDAINKTVAHLIDWQAGDLSKDFLENQAFGNLDSEGPHRIWLRYKGEFWDVKGRRKLNFETSNLSYDHVIRVQCDRGFIGDSLLLGAEELTIIHHCQDKERDWNLLFQGKLKKFLKQQKDLAYLKIRPKELQRYLKWNPDAKKHSWTYSKWSLWMSRFGVQYSSLATPVRGVWDVIEEYRPYSI